MNVMFCGAAQVVTGSCHLITLDDGYKILLDCGLYQGHDKDFESFNANWLFDPAEIDCVILSHAHIDHTGRLPKLIKDGFKGKIVCTHATRDLAAIMLMDSAKIQERDAEYANKRKGRWEYGKLEPLYETRHVRPCINLMESIGYEHWFRIKKGVHVYLRDSGHILGSASVVIRIKEKNKDTVKIGFTGDIGRPGRPILRDPLPMMDCDFLICESTYGAKLHEAAPRESDHFLRIIEETCVKNNGKLIIPAFSIGRTQEIVYMLDQLESHAKLPRIPVFVDSPLAVNATKVFQSHPECFDEDLLDYMLFDDNPFGFNTLQYIRKVEGSKHINTLKNACIVISASGMATAGRIKHHIFNNIENPDTTILIVGYCAPGTLGHDLRSGKKSVKIFGVHKQVIANVEVMESFSAHGDQQEMITFLDSQNRKRLKKLFLVHGVPKNQTIFKGKLLAAGFKNVFIPGLGERFKL